MIDLSPRQVLFHFVRHWSRRSIAADTGGGQGRLVLVCEAVHVLNSRKTPATVNAIAHEIGIDQGLERYEVPRPPTGDDRLDRALLRDGRMSHANARSISKDSDDSGTADGRQSRNRCRGLILAVVGDLVVPSVG